MKTVRRRSNEKPGINNGIRQKSRQKKALYKEQGRSQAWREADAQLQAEINEKKEAFVETVLKDPPQNYYEAVKKLSVPDSKASWDVMELFPNDEPGAAGEGVGLLCHSRRRHQPGDQAPTSGVP